MGFDYAMAGKCPCLASLSAGARRSLCLICVSSSTVSLWFRVIAPPLGYCVGSTAKARAILILDSCSKMYPKCQAEGLHCITRCLRSYMYSLYNDAANSLSQDSHDVWGWPWHSFLVSHTYASDLLPSFLHELKLLYIMACCHELS